MRISQITACGTRFPAGSPGIFAGTSKDSLAVFYTELYRTWHIVGLG